jgi:hypothetical protein
MIYRRLVQRMQLVSPESVESLKARDDGREKTYRSIQKHESPSLHDLLYTGRHWLDLSFITSLKSNLCTVLTTQNAIENNCINSHAQTEHDCTSAECTFNWNTSVTFHKQGTVGFHQPKPLPRSLANSTVTVCTYVCVLLIVCWKR